MLPVSPLAPSWCLQGCVGGRGGTWAQDGGQGRGAAEAFALPCCPPARAGEGHGVTPVLLSLLLAWLPTALRVVERVKEHLPTMVAPESTWKTWPCSVPSKKSMKMLRAGGRILEPFSKGTAITAAYCRDLQPPPARLVGSP